MTKLLTLMEQQCIDGACRASIDFSKGTLMMCSSSTQTTMNKQATLENPQTLIVDTIHLETSSILETLVHDTFDKRSSESFAFFSCYRTPNLSTPFKYNRQ